MRDRKEKIVQLQRERRRQTMYDKRKLNDVIVGDDESLVVLGDTPSL